MQPTVYGISNCDTVKKARAWLTARGVEHRFHDFRKDGLPVALVDEWIGRLGWQPLVNRKGTTWRKLDAQRQAAVVDAPSARALMLEQSSVVKRPVVQWRNGELTVGFDAGQWEVLAGR